MIDPKEKNHHRRSRRSCWKAARLIRRDEREERERGGEHQGGVSERSTTKVFMGIKGTGPLWMTRRLSTKSRQDYAAILDVGKYLVAEEAVE